MLLGNSFPENVSGVFLVYGNRNMSSDFSSHWDTLLGCVLILKSFGKFKLKIGANACSLVFIEIGFGFQRMIRPIRLTVPFQEILVKYLGLVVQVEGLYSLYLTPVYQKEEISFKNQVDCIFLKWMKEVTGYPVL
jgi:hypothetical protein